MRQSRRKHLCAVCCTHTIAKVYEYYFGDINHLLTDATFLDESISEPLEKEEHFWTVPARRSVEEGKSVASCKNNSSVQTCHRSGVAVAGAIEVVAEALEEIAADEEAVAAAFSQIMVRLRRC